MSFVQISDPDDPRLLVYRDLNHANLTRHSGRFIAEGRLLVHRLLGSCVATESILCSERCRRELDFLAASSLPVYLVPQALISQITGFNFHRGMLACGLRPANAELSVVAGSAPGERLIVVCPQIVDPSNLAGVVRNCAAFGVDGLLLGPHCADVYSRRVVRVSMGTVFTLTIRVSDDLATELHALNDRYGCQRVAAVLNAGAVPLPEARRPARLALLFGSEGHGLDPCWVAMCDQQVTLPMKHNTDSLNLATSTGVFLYHFTHVAPSTDHEAL
jgi:tRNA G18 (ribose-2'-O)-methylase SpoU